MIEITDFLAPERDVYARLTEFQRTRGMLCAMKRKKRPTVAELCQNKNRIVILDRVMNPTNVGAVIRLATALGMDALSRIKKQSPKGGCFFCFCVENSKTLWYNDFIQSYINQFAEGSL